MNFERSSPTRLMEPPNDCGLASLVERSRNVWRPLRLRWTPLSDFTERVLRVDDVARIFSELQAFRIRGIRVPIVLWEF